MPKFQGSIFDVDGVRVDSPHEKAWRESLRQLMESSWRGIRDRTTWSPDAFTSHVYQQYVSGKPRISGARAALDYFQLPDAESRVASVEPLPGTSACGLLFNLGRRARWSPGSG